MTKHSMTVVEAGRKRWEGTDAQTRKAYMRILARISWSDRVREKRERNKSR